MIQITTIPTVFLLLLLRHSTPLSCYHKLNGRCELNDFITLKTHISLASANNTKPSEPTNHKKHMQYHEENFPPLEDIVWAEKFGAFDDNLGQSVIRLYKLSCADEFARAIIRERVRDVQTRRLTGSLVPFQKPQFDHGEFSPGITTDNQRIYFPVQALCSGIGFVGGTGAGKSTALFRWIPPIIKCGSCVWVIEPYKNDWRQLLPVVRLLGKEMIILRARDCKLNPLQAGKLDPQTHLAMIVDVLVRVLEVPGRARSILAQGCHDLYKRFGIWQGNTKAWPCLFDLYEWIYSSRGLNPPARDALLDRLGTLLISGKCLAYRVGWDPVELKHTSIIWEFRDCGETLKKVLIDSCLFSVFQHEYQRGISNAPLSLLVVIEDALRFLHADQTHGSEITPLDELAAVVRGSGIGLCALCQTAHGVSRRLMASWTFKVMGHLNLHEDYQILGADMGMSAEQITWAQHHLRPGMYIGQLGIGSWQEPFVFHTQPVNLRRIVDEAAVVGSQNVLKHLHTVPAAEFDRWEPHHVIKISNEPATSAPQLSEVEARFLRSVVGAPGKPSSVYAKQASLNGATAAAVRVRLVTLGYLREHPVATGRKGRMSIVLEPLAKAIVATSGELQEIQS